MTTDPKVTFSREHVGGWGMAVGGQAEVFRPASSEQIAAAFESSDDPIALRGNGRSYGDASMATGGKVLDLTAMNRILAFDAETGIARVEPGVRIRDLWRHSIAFGYWPPVVPGTMQVTVGGAVSMNVHGKNCSQVGPFGDCVRSLRLLTPSGELLDCSREQNADVFHAVIGGFGMLGCLVEIELKLKRVHSGRMRVWGYPIRNLEDGFAVLEADRGRADYLVGWCDLYAKGSGLGRGVMHRADQLDAGEDPDGEAMLRPEAQDVPSTLFGLVPKGWIWPGMWCAFQLGMVRTINAVKVRAGYKEGRDSPYLQTHGAFHFLLDYVPRWQWMTKPGGLIQFQPFVPLAQSHVLREVVEQAQAAGFSPYLGVLKRHREDDYLMSHGLEGYSLAIEFGVPRSEARRKKLWELTFRLADHVLDHGGKFYWAKDATLRPQDFERVHGAEAIATFKGLKERLDPRDRLQTDLSRRLFRH
ncbi:MAG: FAD-binding oxidoreductase [Planctomycetota bacterium]